MVKVVICALIRLMNISRRIIQIGRSVRLFTVLVMAVVIGDFGAFGILCCI